MWKDVPGFEGLYQVSSNNGGVWSVPRTVPRVGNRGALSLQGRVLTMSKSRGYVGVQLSKESKPHSFRLHILVWITFKGAVPVGLEINHKDGDKANNRLDNLEVVTHRYNMQHARDTGLLNLRDWSGINNPKAKVTGEIRASIVRDYLESAVTTRRRSVCFHGAILKIADKYGLGRGTVRTVLRGEGLCLKR